MRSIEYGESITTGFETPLARAARDTGQDSPSQQPREHVRIAKKITPLQFQVRSAEGDTVALSVNALQEVAVARAAAAGAGIGGSGTAAYSPPPKPATKGTMELNGPLSEADLRDIEKALIAFSAGDNEGTLSPDDYTYINLQLRASLPGEPPQK